MTREKIARKAKNKADPSLQTTETIVKEPALRQEQSLELVRTAIAATLFKIIFLRKVFPASVKWNMTTYNPQDPDFTYESFMSSSKEAKQGEVKKWQVPVPNQRAVLDNLMFHLEHGIKDALSMKYLSKISLSFHTPGDAALDPTNCLESYHLSVFYGQDDEPSLTTEIRNNRGSEFTTMSLREGKSKLQSMLNGVVDHFHLIPEVVTALRMRPLPGKIQVAVKLLYTDEAPAGYQALCFDRYTGIPWDEKENNIGASEDGKYKFDTGFHGLAFNYLLPMTKESRITTAAVQNSGSLSTSSPRNIIRSVSKLRRRPSQFSVSDGDHTQSNVLNEVQQVVHHVSRRDESSQLDTQHYPTSPAHFLPAKSISDSVESPTFDFPDYTEVLREQAESRLKHRAPRHDGWLYTIQSEEINCECMSSNHDGLVIECPACQNFHHAECYGYLSRPPRTEFCYGCINDIYGYERIRIPPRRFDCHLRRTIRFFESYPNKKTFAEVTTHLGTDARIENLGTTTQNVLGDLVGKGYILRHGEEQSQQMTEDSEFELALGKELLIRDDLFNPRGGIPDIFVDTEYPLASNVALASSSNERAESIDRRPFSEAPHTPRAGSRNAPILLRGIQHSSRRAFSVDTDSTRTTVGSPAFAAHTGTREQSVNSNVPATGTDQSNAVLQDMDISFPSYNLSRERSRTKRAAEDSRQARAGRKKMK